MKKILAFFLALTLSLPLFAGCKKAEDEKPIPTVIIPGIMGTVLEDTNGHTVWPPSVGDGAFGLIAAIGNLMKLQLPDNAESDGTLQPVRNAMADYQDGDKIGAMGAYTALATTLAEEFGYENVFFFGYDWRLDNSETADALSDYIASVLEQTGAKKVNIVAHSMGGLVTSGYLKKYKADGKLNKVITCGTPFYGAQDATDTLQGKGGGFFKDTQFGDAAGSLAPMFTSIPSLYELMPAAGWDAYLTDGKLPDTAPAAQKKAFAYFENVIGDLAKVWEGVDHVNIAGSNYHTNDVAGDADGDGTVAFTSARADGLFDSCTTKFQLTHVELVSDTAPLELIVSSLAQ